MPEIKELIPQREPFLFITNVTDVNENEIIVSHQFSDTEDFFKGHFPGNPIVPGVLITEHCFQSGAALISYQSEGNFNDKLAVVSRIQSAKFKNILRPNEEITTKTTLVEMVGNAAYFRSVVKNSKEQKVLLLEFACTLIEEK